MNGLLFWWITWGEWRAYPIRMAASILAIATGVALGFAVHLVNRAALSELSEALNTVSGKADLEVTAMAPSGFDEALYRRLAGLAEVADASPVVDRTLALANGQGSIEIIGIDVLRAATITPALLPNAVLSNDFSKLFAADTLFLSRATENALNTMPGKKLEVICAGRPVTLQVEGSISDVPGKDRIGVMDIGGAQWRLDMIGRLSRIDLKLTPGIGQDAARRAILAVLPAGAQLVTPNERDARTDSLSRAYRVNLDMLALMALFTGAFLVYSTQSLSVARRAGQGALLRVVGVSRRHLIWQVVSEGALLGVVGSGLGLALGVALAQIALIWLGGDLGGGYFAGLRPHLVLAASPAVTFFILGLGAALLGSFLPAQAAARVQPAIALKSPGEVVDPAARPPARLALSLLGAGAVLAFFPPIAGLALAGYGSMGLLLFGGIALMPRLAHSSFGRLVAAPKLRLPLPLDLALKRLWGAPTQGAVALCGIVAATSLMVAMGIMVTSFRQSVDSWVERLLPAQLYLHVNGPIESVGLDRPSEERLVALAGVLSVDFLRSLPLQLSPSRPPVVLLARSLPAEGPEGTLVMVASAAIPAGQLPVWISEAVVDLYGYRPGQSIWLPLPDASGTMHPVQARVAGVWRDYARQSGAIVMRERDYTALTGDALRSDAGFHTAADTDLNALEDRIKASLSDETRQHAEFSRPAQIRALSLKIFDRSFAVTYVLEGVAIVIGLLGVAATFSAQTLARSREFGMLRHVGVLRIQIVQMLSWEGALLGCMGVLAGVVLGLAMSQILIHVINPQSFHWTMDTHIPWALLLWVGALLLAASGGTAVLAGREALAASAIFSVREDW